MNGCLNITTMLTLKQIYDSPEQIIAGLQKKHFANAEETIRRVMAIDSERKAAQQQKDNARTKPMPPRHRPASSSKLSLPTNRRWQPRSRS